MSDKIIAVSCTEYKQSGCVNCGCDYCHGTGISGGGSLPLRCGECDTFFVVLADGMEKSSMGMGDGTNPVEYPVRVDHPRKGIAKHEFVSPDVPPAIGEYWSPRGVGHNGYNRDLSGFVKCKPAGERIVKMVEKVIGKTPKTYLDYRPKEPTWIQLKVDETDGFDLDKLCRMCSGDRIVTEERLRECLK